MPSARLGAVQRWSQQVRVNIRVQQLLPDLKQPRPKLVVAQRERVVVFHLEMLPNQVGHQRAVLRRRFRRHTVERRRAVRLPGIENAQQD